MRKFTQADYEAVKAYERDFTRAIESRYCTGLLQNELDTVQKIYNECLNRQANLSCGGCVLQMMTSVGRLYFGYLRDNPVKEVKEEEITPVIEEVIPEEPVVEEDDSDIPETVIEELIPVTPVEEVITDTPEEPVEVLFQDEKPKKERRQRKSKTNEDKTEHKTGEGMPDAL